MPLGAAAGTAIATAAGTAAQVGGGIFTAKKNRDFAKKMSDLQWSRDQMMWDMTNQYNSPQEQMARLKAAGLNPNMVYGQGVAGATGKATDTVKYQNPSTGSDYYMPQIIEAISTMASAVKTSVETGRTKGLTDQDRVKTDILRSEREIIVDTKDRAKKIIKAELEGKQAAAALKWFDAAIEYVAMGGKGDFDPESWKIDRYRDTPRMWERTAMSQELQLRPESKSLDNRLKLAEVQLNERLRNMGINSNTISFLIGLLNALK